MQGNDKEFWGRLQQAVEVVVASRDSEQLLGVRDGFRRYFQGGAGETPTISVRSALEGAESSRLWTRAEETLEAAGRCADELLERLGGEGVFCVATEEGLSTLEVDGRPRTFVHCWSVVATTMGSGRGGGGPVELPESFVASFESGRRLEVPGTRRRGGILGSLTGDPEARRRGFALATFHALSSLFAGLGAPTGGSRRGD